MFNRCISVAAQVKLAGTLNKEKVPFRKIAHRKISLKFFLPNLQI